MGGEWGGLHLMSTEDSQVFQGQNTLKSEAVPEDKVVKCLLRMFCRINFVRRDTTKF